jgi:23S rRNA (uracil1939-C5)-methyltransferase
MHPETVTISKIVNGGYGFGRLASGHVVLVRHVLPGETVIVTIEEKKKNYLLGNVREIVAPHPARRIAPCPYAYQCGGCDLQHCRYDDQLQIKKEIVVDLLLRSGKEELQNSSPQTFDPIPAPTEFAYRQRLRLQVDTTGNLGFYRFQSHVLIPIKSCLLAGAALNLALDAIKRDADCRKLLSLASEVELQENPHTGKIVVIFQMARKPRPADILSATRFCRNTVTIERVFFAGQDFSLMGPYGAAEGVAADRGLGILYPFFAELSGGLQLDWEVGGFCQVNLQQNRALIATVVDFCRVLRGMKILDLFCGMGNFAIPLASLGAVVLGIEGQGSAIRSAKLNAARAGVHACFQQAPIHTACAHLLADEAQFDCILIDPPRQGAPDLAGSLAKLAAKRLVYISCDPATLCRDLSALVEHGFSIGKIQLIDMFPQTHHIESIVLLEK